VIVNPLATTRMAASEKRILIVERRNRGMQCPHFQETCFSTMVEDTLLIEGVFLPDLSRIDDTGIMGESEEGGNSRAVENGLRSG
jgi:hypothetical protein